MKDGDGAVCEGQAFVPRSQGVVDGADTIPGHVDGPDPVPGYKSVCWSLRFGMTQLPIPARIVGNCAKL